MPPYQERFAVGTKIRIAPLRSLEDFQRSWKYHNNLRSEQLAFAGREADVEKVGFYHGGDVLYELRGVPGVWNEQCLERVT